MSNELKFFFFSTESWVKFKFCSKFFVKKSICLESLVFGGRDREIRLRGEERWELSDQNTTDEEAMASLCVVPAFEIVDISMIFVVNFYTKYESKYYT